MAQLFLRVGSLNCYQMYFAFYILVLIVLPRQFTITFQIAGIKPVHSGVYQVLCVCGTAVHGKLPHANDLHTYRFVESVALF